MVLSGTEDVSLVAPWVALELVLNELEPVLRAAPHFLCTGVDEVEVFGVNNVEDFVIDALEGIAESLGGCED